MLKQHHQCVVCNIVAALLAIAIGGPIAWWALDRDPAYIVLGGVAIPDPVVPGKELDLARTIRIMREGCTGLFNREVKDASGYIWTFAMTRSTFASFKIGDYHTHSVTPFIVPMGIADGPAEVTSNIWSVCNPVQKFWPVHYRSAPLIVTIQRAPKQGPKGEQGIQGETGEQGERGERGRPGVDLKP